MRNLHPRQLSEHLSQLEDFPSPFFHDNGKILDFPLLLDLGTMAIGTNRDAGSIKKSKRGSNPSPLHPKFLNSFKYILGTLIKYSKFYMYTAKKKQPAV